MKNWREAKESTLNLWAGIRDSIGTVDPLDLLIEINAICDLCDVAQAEAQGRPQRCRFCPAYQQFGGCQDTCAQLSELVVQGEWDELHRLVEQFIGQLQALEVPPQAELMAVVEPTA